MKMDFCCKYQMWIDLDLYDIANKCSLFVPIDCFGCSEKQSRTVTKEVEERYQHLVNLYRRVDEETQSI